MSSFNIGGPNNRPQVTEAQNMMNNGGGGNTGYMQGRGKKKKKAEEIDPVILEGEAEDKFEYVEDEYEEEDDDDYYNPKQSSKSSFDASKSDDKFIKEGEEEQNTPKKEEGPVKKVVFGLIDKFADRIVSEKNVKKRDDDNPGGDFLSLSGKDI